MSKVKLLLDVVEDIRTLANSLQAIADSIQEGAPQTEPTPEPENTTLGETEMTEVPITMDDVRNIMAHKSSEGKAPAIRKLLKNYNAVKLSDINPEMYPALMKEVMDL